MSSLAGTNSSILFVCVYYMYVLCLCRDWFCGLIREKVYMTYEKSFWNVHLTEFDCPECGWQDVKIQLLIT